MKSKETKINPKFDYSYNVRLNELGVYETKFLAEGTCPICNEETTASILIPKLSDDHSEIPNFIAMCDKCKKEFTIINDYINGKL